MSQSKIYVGNLPYSVTEEDLRSLFEQYGAVEDVKLIIDRETGRSKGFAFISLASAADAKAALAANGVDFNGRSLKVNEARDDDRGGRR